MPETDWLPTDPHADIAERMRVHQAPVTGRKWRLRDMLALAGMVLLILCAIVMIPGFLYDVEHHHVTWALGLLGIWRYGWWFNHAQRARRYEEVKFPSIRRQCDKVWHDGWRPRHLHIQMTTYYEEEAITRHVMKALLDQIREIGVPATIWVGSGARHDERIIEEVVWEHGADLDAEVAFIRQNQPGKRMAIGLVMRAIIRTAPDDDDLILFMDGDAILGPGVLARCCAMFGADDKLEALTTDEEAITYGPAWLCRWLNMRFAQRRLAMQSHAMSDKVLTLTGRMSMFRARQICNLRFVRTIEADFLDHWLWGRFRFLSGDDKSTWYYLLGRGAKMLYVPDVCVYTVEVIKGSGRDRMVQNLRRWSGNMLRNGARALQLGPKKVGWFIWWCVLDQRLAIWTMLVSPTLILLSLIFDPGYVWIALSWVLVSRLVLSLFLFRYAKRPDMTWPFLLYVNQLLNASVKSFMIFFPHKQRWANRGGQRAQHEVSLTYRAKSAIAMFQFVTIVLVFVQAVSWVMGSGALFQPF
ncbi:glycosyltransferase [Mameliella sp.]|uniref:glycosyltransferase n=1 Tax=Mameliella sp. TaxID=1924940 RepID=UPI003BA999BC